MTQTQGFEAFVPASLPPKPPIEVDTEMLGVLSAADQALGRLDGVIQTVPNPDLFVAMYVRREAVLSSQIEGTQSTLEDLLAAELEPATPGIPDDVEEVVNYCSVPEVPCTFALASTWSALFVHTKGRARSL